MRLILKEDTSAPKVAILLATYNGAKFLEEQINSILWQTYKNWFLLIHDDGSTDGTKEILYKYKRKYPSKILIIEDNKRWGSAKDNFAFLMHFLYKNFNDFHYIMFSDQDDVWLPNKIEVSLKKINELEKKYGTKYPLLVYTDLMVVDENLKPISCSLWKYQKLNPKHNKLNHLLLQNIVTGCTTLFNKKALELALPLPKEAIIHDWWLALVASTLGYLDFIEVPTVLYRQHAYNETGAKNWNWLEAIPRIFKKKEFENLKKNFFASIKQAEIFLKRYEDFLTEYQKEVIKNYIDIVKSNKIKRLFIIFNYKFFKSGLIKNLGSILFILLFI